MSLYGRSKPLARGTPNCESPNPTSNLTSRLNSLLSSSGPGYVLSLCPGEQYPITAPLLFTAPNQEISTAGYPTDETRATLIVNGLVYPNATGHTTAVDGTCDQCGSIKLRNVQVNGTRLGVAPISGSANIEMGGPNANQIIEFVHSFDPRSWSCLHVSEGSFLNCTDVTVQNNDIGPAGSDQFQQWADGISFSCRNGLVRNNMVNNPTDGGIVLFGSPGTRVENNTIWVETHTLMGGINLVDYEPFDGNYSGVVVTNNTIAGGFATQTPQGSEKDGTNSNDVIIKVGIAIGPRTWFGDKYGTNISTGGTVQDNQFTGAFSYAIGMTSAYNFTVQNNVLVGNTSFIGSRGPNCTLNPNTPSPAPFVIQLNTTTGCTTQSDFTSVNDGDDLVCVVPPNGGSYWPFGGNPGNSSSTVPVSPPEANPTTRTSHSSGSTVGIIVGSILGVLLVAIVTYFIRKWALKQSRARGARVARLRHTWSSVNLMRQGN